MLPQKTPAGGLLGCAVVVLLSVYACLFASHVDSAACSSLAKRCALDVAASGYTRVRLFTLNAPRLPRRCAA